MELREITSARVAELEGGEADVGEVVLEAHHGDGMHVLVVFRQDAPHTLLDLQLGESPRLEVTVTFEMKLMPLLENFAFDGRRRGLQHRRHLGAVPTTLHTRAAVVEAAVAEPLAIGDLGERFR